MPLFLKMKSYQLYFNFIELILAVLLKGFTQLNLPKGTFIEYSDMLSTLNYTAAGNRPERSLFLIIKYNMGTISRVQESYSCWEERIF